MSLHATVFNSSEYHNAGSSRFIFPQPCRSRYSKGFSSSSTSSTRSKRQSQFYADKTSSTSLTPLLKLLNHHYRLHIAKGRLAVPSRPRRVKPPISGARGSRQESHPLYSTRFSLSRVITIDINKMSSTRKKISPRRPTVEFHMNTRRRASQSTSLSTSSGSNESSPLAVTRKSTSPTLEESSALAPTAAQTEIAQSSTSPTEGTSAKASSVQKQMAQPSTPDSKTFNSPPNSTSSSSPLSSLGTTPESLAASTIERIRNTTPTPSARDTQLERNATISQDQVDRKRKVSSENDSIEAPSRPSKRIKAPNRQPRRRTLELSKIRKSTRRLLKCPILSPGPPLDKADVQSNAAPALEADKTSVLPISSGESAEVGECGKPGRKPRPKRKTKNQLDLEVNLDRHGEWIEATMFAHVDRSNPVFYAADGVTKYVAPARESPAKNGRGGANTGAGVKKRRGGGGWNKGMGKGKGKGKGRGKNNRKQDDDEDPFDGKDPASDDHKALVKILKARQVQLRTFFKDVGRQQADILDILSLRDLNKLMRKSNAHKKVPEYDEILEELEARKADAINFAKRKLTLDTELAERQCQQQLTLIKQQYAQRVSQAHEEHLLGAQGDLMLLQKEEAAAQDPDRTDDGAHSEDPNYFPRYHETPEANERIRGYTSSKITDEKAFKHQIAACNYDDQVRREVLQSDVMEPVIHAIERSNKARREAESRERTQNMMALSNEAVRELNEIQGYLIPTRLSSQDLNSWSLSMLADVSEYHADRFKDKTYRYVPLPPGQTFPKEAVNFEPLPTVGAPARRAHPPFPRTPNIAPPRAHQFVFQTIEGHAPTFNPPPPTPVQRAQQRLVTQFVNQTIESRKAAGNQPKGGQRVLLPKV